jgi:hypothetical protein
MNAKQTPEPSQEIVVRTQDDVEEFVRILATGDTSGFNEEFDDPDEVSRRIIASILAAPDSTGMFAAASGSDAVGWREYKGRPVEIRGFRWRPSDFEEGSPVFVIVQAIEITTGEIVNLTTGASAVLAQLAWMAQNGQLVGAKVTLMESDKPTRAGYRPLKLVPAA